MLGQVANGAADDASCYHLPDRGSRRVDPWYNTWLHFTSDAAHHNSLALSALTSSSVYQAIHHLSDETLFDI